MKEFQFPAVMKGTGAGVELEPRATGRGGANPENSPLIPNLQ
jgi:hypothetical protein